MYKSLNRWLLKMTKIRRRLSRLLTEHHHVRVDQTESIDNNFAFDALDGVNDHGNGSVREGLKALLGVDVDARQPAAEPRMGMVPSHYHLWSVE